MRITRTYLEQTSADQIVPARVPDYEVRITQAEEPSPEFARFLYTAVGGDWHWTGQLDWDHQRWLDWLTAPGRETWVAYLRGTPAGYFDMRQVGTEVEIEHFGLLPAFIGRGLGGHLLTFALRRAWALPGTTRVWLHTNTLDGPHALRNYRARGLVPYRTETEDRELGPAPGPWPGANRPLPAN